jgi:hypothetical protein
LSRRAEAGNRVANARIGEAPLDQAEIGAEIGVRDRGDDGYNLVALHLGEEIPDQRLFHGLVDEMDVQQRRGIGDCCMAAVQDADLHQLVGRHPRRR